MVNENLPVICLDNVFISSLILSTESSAYRWVVLIYLCPSIRLTVSIGTPSERVIKLAKVWRAVCINSMQIKIRSSQTFDG